MFPPTKNLVIYLHYHSSW